MVIHKKYLQLKERFIDAYGDEKGIACFEAYVDNQNLDIALGGETHDALENNIASAQKAMQTLLISEKEKYTLIIDKFINDFYNEGLKTSAQELGMTPTEFGNVREKNRQVKILQENTKQLAFTLFTDLEKEFKLMSTNIALNNIPFTNKELKQDIQKLFGKFDHRLNAIAVTEGDRTFNQALSFGYAKSGVVTHKMWVSIVDSSTSQICLGLNGEIVEIGQPFSSGDYGPPAHINCRSRIRSITISET